MDLYELGGQTELTEFYQRLELENTSRQYSFLQSLIGISLATGRQFVSQSVIKALNYHAISCLHDQAGIYRPCQVWVGGHSPPEFWKVQGLMDEFVNQVNRHWTEHDPIYLTAYVLWRLNWIHPFINGNGRTARAVAYFVLCMRVGGFIPGSVTLPELLKSPPHRGEYCRILSEIDASAAKGPPELQPLMSLLEGLLDQQIQS